MTVLKLVVGLLRCLLGGRHVTITFKAVCGPGDDGEPVLTVMMPNED